MTSPKNHEGHDTRVYANGKLACRTCMARFLGEKGAAGLDNLPTLAEWQEGALTSENSRGKLTAPDIAKSQPADMDFRRHAYVYRLWGAKGVCLYVGQTTSMHPQDS